jgi:hypothetical protein
MEAAASVRTAKAGLSSEGVASSYPAMVESTESAGMHSLMTSRATGVNVRAMIEVRSTRMKIIAVDDSPAMRDERVVVVDDSPAAVPIESPTVPTPAEAGK